MARNLPMLIACALAALGAASARAHDHGPGTGRPDAAALMHRHRFREALDAARDAAVSAPDSLEARLLLGDAHFALGNYAEAEALYLHAVGRTLSMPTLARLAIIHELRGRFDEADAAWSEAHQAAVLLGAPASDRAWCLTLRGELALSQERLDDARAHLAAALETFGGAHAAERLLAEVDRRRGDLRSARDRLMRIAEDHPMPEYWIALGELEAAIGASDRAAAWYRKAEDSMLDEVRQGDLGHARELVELWLEHEGDVEQAAALALRDLAEVRRDAEAFATAARALHAAGRTAEALDHMAQALKRKPNDPVIRAQAAKLRRDAVRLAEVPSRRE